MSAKMERTSTPGIYRRGGRYVVVYRDPLGRQRKQAAATLAEARAVKATVGADVVRGEYQERSRARFDEYAVEWVRSYKGRTSRGFREQTRADYARLLGIDPATWSPLDPICGAIAFFGRARLVDIGPRDVKRYVTALEQRGLEPSSVRKILAPLRVLFATAVEEQLVRVNPAIGIRVTRQASLDESGEERPKVKTLNDGELLALLEQTPAEWRVFFEFLAHTGLRIGEAIALQWRHVDLGKRRVQVRRRWYRGSFAPPKSRYGRREVPLSDGMAVALWELRKQTSAADGQLVFTSARGGMIVPSNLMSRVLKPAGRAAGVGDWIGFHTFRHTCATNLFRHGLNAKQVQAWMGHHSPAFTLETYVHLLPEDLPERPAFLDTLTGRSGNEAATRPAETTRGATYPEPDKIPAPAADSSDDPRSREAVSAYS